MNQLFFILDFDILSSQDSYFKKSPEKPEKVFEDDQIFWNWICIYNPYLNRLEPVSRVQFFADGFPIILQLFDVITRNLEYPSIHIFSSPDHENQCQFSEHFFDHACDLQDLSVRTTFARQFNLNETPQLFIDGLKYIIMYLSNFFNSFVDNVSVSHRFGFVDLNDIPVRVVPYIHQQGQKDIFDEFSQNFPIEVESRFNELNLHYLKLFPDKE